jgi:excisionase family DNA binding protein
MTKTADVTDGVVSVKEARRLTSFSTSYLYMLMGRGDLRFAKVGKRRVILRSSLQKLIEDNLVGVEKD